MIIYSIAAITILTILFWLMGLKRKRAYCPVCLATVFVWVVGLIFFYSGFEINSLFLAILISISLGALIEKYGQRFHWYWKLIMVLLNAPAIYYLLQKDLAKAAVLAGVAVILTWLFSKLKTVPPKIKNDQFEQCCD